mmetsp:Transcript_7033/g.6172  ORF Transcript_7033/g.6172 Transcript_7033/m.6172 type:complete len:97 (+) Transcript_7033:744-1034(+)
MLYSSINYGLQGTFCISNHFLVCYLSIGIGGWKCNMNDVLASFNRLLHLFIVLERSFHEFNLIEEVLVKSSSIFQRGSSLYRSDCSFHIILISILL